MANKESQSPKIPDAEIITGVCNHKEKYGSILFELCYNYYEETYKGLFFVGEEDSKDIFQNTLLTLLEKIESHSIYVEDGILKGNQGKPFTSSLTTYFMSIAQLKYKEWVRKHPIGVFVDLEAGKKSADKLDYSLYKELLYGDNPMLPIIADCISKMSERCNQILTLFYYKEKSLDEILVELPSYKSKDALKTEKYKCMRNLRESANNIYGRLYK